MNRQHVLETQRTYLRQICEDDFEQLTAILGDIEVMYAWEHAFTDEEIRGWIRENLLRYARDGYSYWAVVLKDTGSLIGVAGIFREEAEDQAYIGVGYIFHKAYWLQGFALACARACKDYAFDTLQIPLLTAQIRPENTSSRRVAEKLGMAEIKRFNRDYRGKSVPHILYGCSK